MNVIIDSLIPDPRWFDAPRERTPQFFRTYAQVSIAIQEALRQLAPAALFADLNEFKNDRACYAMLAFAASRPFRPKTRTDFTYDLTNAAAMATFYRFSQNQLVEGMEQAQARLLVAGQESVAKLYDQRNLKFLLQAVKNRKRYRKPLHKLVQSEGKLVNELTAFSGLHDRSPKEQVKEAAAIVKRWRNIVQNLCFGTDLSSLAEPLFEVATTAYLRARAQESTIEEEASFEILDLAA